VFLASLCSLLGSSDEGVVVCIDGLFEVFVGVDEAGEHGLELRRGEVDALVEHGVEVSLNGYNSVFIEAIILDRV